MITITTPTNNNNTKVRKVLLLAVTKAQVDCLLAKIHQVGPGNTQFAKKRDWAIYEDLRMVSGSDRWRGCIPLEEAS